MFRGRYNKGIIELVKNQPILYDSTHPQYKDSFMTNKMWNQLGAEMNMSANQFKKKWRNLRDSYLRHLRSVKAVAIGQKPTADGQYLNWPWASAMEFLRKHVEITVVTVPAEPDDDEPEMALMEMELEPDNDTQKTEQKNNSESSASLPTPPISIGARVAHTKQKLRHHKDTTPNKKTPYLKPRNETLSSSTQHLMIGYAKTMERFSERRKILTKMKIAQVMMEAELEEEQERSQTESHSLDSHPDAVRSHPTHFTADPNPHEHFMCEASGEKNYKYHQHYEDTAVTPVQVTKQEK